MHFQNRMSSRGSIFIIRTGILIAQNGEGQTFTPMPESFFEQSDKARKSLFYIDSLYKSFGYNIISISDYQFINRYESKNEWYVPVYEHGYQYYKNHHLVLNSKK